MMGGMTRKWGKAGERLDENAARARRSQILATQAATQRQREANDAVAYRLWKAGMMKPYMITFGLDAKGLYGPEVDIACGAKEPDVDLWEAGKLYPRWDQVLLLAELCEVTPRMFFDRDRPIPVFATSLRFHRFDDPQPDVLAFEPAAIADVVDQDRS